MRNTNAELWAVCREAVALGDSLKHAAESLGLSYQAAKKRSSRERWPSPAKMAVAVAAPVKGADLAAETWAQRGERHRLRVFQLVDRELCRAKPERLTSWADIERASRIADKALGLGQSEAPLVSLTFPGLTGPLVEDGGGWVKAE